MCGGSKNKTTTNSTQSWAPPQYIQDALKGQIGNATNVSQTPYNPATNTTIANLTPQQLQAFEQVSQNQGIANPYINQATSYANQGASAITPDQIQANMNPYTQDVINATLAQKQQSDLRQQQGLNSSAAAQGALGGDRNAIEQAVLQGQQGLATGQLAAGLNQSNYAQAQAQANANRAAAGQGAFTLGSLGQEAQGTAYTDVGQLAQAGAAQQQQAQNAYNAATANAQQQSQYPFQTAQWLAGITSGLGSIAGGTGTGQSTTVGPSPNVFGQAAGLGLTAASFLKDGGAVDGEQDEFAGKLGHAIQTMRKHLPHRDDGGGVDFVLGDGGLGGGVSGGESSGLGIPSLGLNTDQQKAMQKLGTQMAGGQSQPGGANNPFAAPKGPTPSQNVAPQPPHGGGVPIQMAMPYTGRGLGAVLPYGQHGFADGGDVDDQGADISFNGIPLPTKKPDDFPAQAAPQGLGDNVPLPVKRPEDLGQATDTTPAAAPQKETIGSQIRSALGTDSLPSLGLSDNGRMAMREAGLGMLASRSPFFGNVVGEGGLKGMQYYQTQENKQKDVDLKAQSLAQQALQHQEQARHNKASENLLKNQFVPGMGQDQNGNMVQGAWTRDQGGNPVFSPGMIMQTGRGAGAAGHSVYEVKKQAYLNVHPGDEQGALDYAAGHKTMSDTEINKAALIAAQKDAFNNSIGRKDYNAYVQDRMQTWGKALRASSAPATQTQQPPQGQQPSTPQTTPAAQPASVAATPQPVPIPDLKSLETQRQSFLSQNNMKYAPNPYGNEAGAFDRMRELLKDPKVRTDQKKVQGLQNILVNMGISPSHVRQFFAENAQ